MFSAVILRILVMATTSSRSVTGIAGRSAGASAGSARPTDGAGASAGAVAAREGAAEATLRFSR